MQVRFLKDWALGLTERSRVNSLAQGLGRGDDRPLYVLAYHRVTEPGPGALPGVDLISATPAQFDEQMRLIAREYCPVSAEAVLNAAEHGASLPLDAALVTVDDGYRDFKEVIFPIARRHGIRPVLFVPTAYVGEGMFWWDRLARALQAAPAGEIETPIGRFWLRSPVERTQVWKELHAYVVQQPDFETTRRQIEALCAVIAPEVRHSDRVTLDWDELRALARAGATIAAHTHTHPILSRVPLERAHLEIRRSQDLIRREIGYALPIFAYPDGRPHALSDDMLPVLGDEGIKLAFTMIPGRARLRRDNLLRLPRIPVWRTLRLAQFHSHLTPIYYKWRRIRPDGVG